jgi:hypothetical protein
MAKKHRHSESGRRRNERREHDQHARTAEANLEAPWHANPAIRYGFIVLTAVVIFTISVLFIAGVIRW